ncbi:Lactoylglutathione lyase [Paraburkholderia caribensis MBA4]|uniref:Lactoylglutathione lyase n=1 Tax=Paraburkholderia caribensis MBA4 TaxID=1323664 RepID=A0A0P0RHW1_9BURK|nr:VOC family protein [Paraburkholderia caribensis]ALL68376.1 Lactoylglutathione lyase [Paraburkholderia caribensis MBA4]
MDIAPKTVGIDHVGLTVLNLDLTRRFFVECLGWKQVGERPDYPAAFLSDGHALLTFWQVTAEKDCVEFDRKANVGLHHLALKVGSEDGLNDVLKRVTAWPGVRVEFEPEFLGQGPKKHMMFYEPGGIRIEFDFDPRG